MRPANVLVSRSGASWPLGGATHSLRWGLWSTAWVFLLLLGIIALVGLAVRSASLESLSWFLVILVASWAGFLAVRYVVRDALEPESPGRADDQASETPGELRSLARAINRARAGSVYSQTIVAARLASAFLEKVRLSRGLSPQEIERVRGDRTALSALIGDPKLADFVAVHERYTREWPDNLASASAPKAKAAVSNLLDAMEAWS